MFLLVLVLSQPNIISFLESNDEIKKAGATPYILSLEDASVKDFAELFDKEKPDGVVFSAGAGGKGGEERTKAVDYEGVLRSSSFTMLADVN